MRLDLAEVFTSVLIALQKWAAAARMGNFARMNHCMHHIVLILGAWKWVQIRGEAKEKKHSGRIDTIAICKVTH